MDALRPWSSVAEPLYSFLNYFLGTAEVPRVGDVARNLDKRDQVHLKATLDILWFSYPFVKAISREQPQVNSSNVAEK